ncbi:hypothetical protein B0E38_02638 [Streptomyces sp. 111WW2]|nr:hypothetical protein B0E38_02638 [Streptomyces sp. 111WW2]
MCRVLRGSLRVQVVAHLDPLAFLGAAVVTDNLNVSSSRSER